MPAIASLGTDTGGSIRIPAAACGCVGLKPTYGVVPLEGTIPISPTLDHAGPLCRCVADASLILEAIRGGDTEYSYLKRITTKLQLGIKSFRIGLPRQYFFDGIQTEVREAVLSAASTFEELGAELREVELKSMEETARLAADITSAEALAYHHEWLKKRPRSYGNDVRSRLQQGKRLTALDYLLALQQKRAYSEAMERALHTVDLLLTPTLPIVVPRIEQARSGASCNRDHIRQALLSLTRPANLSGLPAISLPCGFSSDGLPIGLQLIGPRFHEVKILRAAYAYEEATPWHNKFPNDT